MAYAVLDYLFDFILSIFFGADKNVIFLEKFGCKLQELISENFQETKLSRQDLSVELTMADGYESFISCTRTTSRGRTCYSGRSMFYGISIVSR